MVNEAGASNGVSNGTSHEINGLSAPSFTVKAGLAQMLKGGVIMDVINAEQVRYSHHVTQFVSNSLYRHG